MYKLYLTLHYLRTRMIAFFAIGAVMLCTMMVLVVLSVMGGWLDLLKKQARNLLGDVIIDNSTVDGFPLYEQFITEIRGWPEVREATPVIYTVGLMRVDTSSSLVSRTVSVIGMRLNEVYSVNAFQDSLYYEHYFPGTTTLGEQRQPLAGYDIYAPGLEPNDPLPIVLPPELQRPLEAKRRETEQQTGRPLDPNDPVDTGINMHLRQNGLPLIPGVFSFVPEPEVLPRYEGVPLPGIIIGRDIIARRESDGRYQRSYPRGHPVQLTYWEMAADGEVDPLPKRQVFRYADDSRTKVYEIDSKHVYVDFDLLQRLLNMDVGERVDPNGETIGQVPARCSQIQVKLAAGLTREQIATVCRRFEQLYHKLGADEQYALDAREQKLVRLVEAFTWEQSQAHIIGAVEKERMLITILFGIISLVAVALVLCILYMIVLEKTREIGVIKSLGGSSAGVATIFIFYGAMVGLVGAILGVLAGTLFVHNINEIQDLLIWMNPQWRVWDLKVYSFDSIPNEVQTADAATVLVIAVLTATCGSLAAAWRAGSMQPVEALRHE